MNPFHLYPQHPLAHPDRPWWRPLTTPISHTRGWERSDGRFAAVPDNDEWSSWDDECADTDPLLCEHDTIDPLPRPAYLIGQVWVWGEADGPMGGRKSGGTMMVGITGRSPVWSNGPPPDDAQLVSGPCAPWAPPGWTP